MPNPDLLVFSMLLIKQGGILSLFFFNVCMDDSSVSLIINIFMFTLMSLM